MPGICRRGGEAGAGEAVGRLLSRARPARLLRHGLHEDGGAEPQGFEVWDQGTRWGTEEEEEEEEEEE